jgi:hypothetical protein
VSKKPIQIKNMELRKPAKTGLFCVRRGCSLTDSVARCGSRTGSTQAALPGFRLRLLVLATAQALCYQVVA